MALPLALSLLSSALLIASAAIKDEKGKFRLLLAGLLVALLVAVISLVKQSAAFVGLF